MPGKRLISLVLLVSATALAGCNNDAKDQNALLMDENQSLRSLLEDRDAALESAHGELREKNLRIADLERQTADASGSGPVDPFGGIAGVTGSVGAGEVKATVESDVLFDSGKATLKPQAKTSLGQVASILNSDYSGKTIRIGGHTDTDPIRKSGYKSNYHLGFERAFAVRDLLISQGVSASRIYLASHGPHEPRGTKQQSRRVEIVVLLNE